MDFKRRIGLGLLLAGLQTSAFGFGAPVVSVSTTSVVLASNATSTSTVPSAVAASTWTWRTVPNNAFQVGENLLFSVKWGIITAGRSTLAVSAIEQVANRPAYHLISEAKSTGFVDTFYTTRDRNETWLDVQSLTTLRYEKHIHEGKFRVEAVIELDQVNHKFHDYSQRLDKGTSDYVEGAIPQNVMDVLGSMYYIRTQPLEVGQTFVIDVYDGKKIWPLVVKVVKHEKIKVSAGKFDTFMVEPELREPGIFVNKGKKLQVWMTTDPSHMPVLLRSEVFFGHVAAELISYQGSNAQPIHR
jgi:hypothetical protein